MAFPMFATVVWLVWVLGHQVGIDAAAALLGMLVAVAFSPGAGVAGRPAACAARFWSRWRWHCVGAGRLDLARRRRRKRRRGLGLRATYESDRRHAMAAWSPAAVR